MRSKHVAVWLLSATVGIWCSLTGTLLAQQNHVGESTTPVNAKSGDQQGWMILNDGMIFAKITAEIPAQEMGQIKSLDVALNQTVAKNAVIAQLDSSSAESELKRAQLQYKSVFELARDDSEIESRKFALEVAKQRLARNLEIGSSISDSEKTELRLAVRGAELSLHKSEKAREQALIDAELRKLDVDAAKRKVERTAILAPDDCIIAQIYKQPGEWVRIGDSVVKVTDLRTLRVDALVEKVRVDLRTIVGSDVHVESHAEDGSKTRLPGKVISYDHEVSSAGQICLHAEIQNIRIDEQWALLPGMSVTLHVAVNSARKNLTARPQPNRSR